MREEGRGTRFGLLLLACLGLASCGIESGVYRYSPPSLSSSAFNIINLRHNVADNDLPGFLGYDLYYRFFDTDSAAQADLASIQALGASSASSAETALSAITAMGYLLAGGKDGTTFLGNPIFRVTAGEVASELEFLITMSASENWQVSKPASTFILLRSNASPPSFAPDGVVPGSPDYSGSAPHPTHLVVVGVARAENLANVLLPSFSLPAALVVTLP